MTIYVDSIKNWGTIGKWCHMLSDKSDEELHQFATSIGLSRRWFQGKSSYSHYDLTPSMRSKALKMGAVRASSRDIAKILEKKREGAHQE